MPVQNSASSDASSDSSDQTDKSDPQGGGASDDNNAPSYVTKEEFEAVNTRLQNMSGAVGSIKDRLGKLAKGAGGGGGGGSDDHENASAEDATLAGRVQAIEAREERWRNKAARESIASVLVAEGQDYEVAQDQARYLQEVFGEQVQVDDGGEVFFRDGDTNVRMGEHVKAYVQTKAKWMLPARKPPGGEPARRGARVPHVPGGKEISYEAYISGNYDRKAMEEGKLSIGPPPDAMAAFDTPPGQE